MDTNKRLTHIVGTFLIQAEGAFLNGAGLERGEYGNVVVPKTYSDFRDRVPYVSSQAWKRWLRNTFQEENPDEPATELEVLERNKKGNPTKIGTKMNPIVFAEDDIFGYMRAEKGQGKARKSSEDEEEEMDSVEEDEKTQRRSKGKAKVQSVMRASPFSASILTSLRKSGWEGVDEGFVHLKEGTPLPYTTKFYNTQLQGIFGLNYSRLGVFRNEGDRIELDLSFVEQYLKEEKIRKVDDNREIYEIVGNPRGKRATMILKTLAMLRGGAKAAQFAIDVSPKLIIVAGLNCGNLIFNDLFEDSKDGTKIKIETLQQVIEDYASRILTPVFIGVRNGYLNPESEKELREWVDLSGKQLVEGIPTVQLSSPIAAVDELTRLLP